MFRHGLSNTLSQAFTTQSRVIHNTTGKITAEIIHRRLTSLFMVPRLGESSRCLYVEKKLK